MSQELVLNPFWFIQIQVITGLDMAIPLMCKGEVATIKVSPRFAYGSKGLEPKIPPNSPLVFEVELIDFENEKDLAELSVSERREIGNRKRERGNFWYGRGESSLAIQCYRRALEFLDEAEGGIQYPTNNQPDVVWFLVSMYYIYSKIRKIGSLKGVDCFYYF